MMDLLRNLAQSHYLMPLIAIVNLLIKYFKVTVIFFIFVHQNKVVQTQEDQLIFGVLKEQQKLGAIPTINPK